MKHLRKCLQCSNYTFAEKCSKGHDTIIPKPAKYSPDDAYVKYRRDAKLDERKRRDLL